MGRTEASGSGDKDDSLLRAPLRVRVRAGARGGAFAGAYFTVVLILVALLSHRAWGVLTEPITTGTLLVGGGAVVGALYLGLARFSTTTFRAGAIGILSASPFTIAASIVGLSGAGAGMRAVVAVFGAAFLGLALVAIVGVRLADVPAASKRAT